MRDSENEFSLSQIDRQIENPTHLLPPGEARLVHDLQSMYDQERSVSIDRVWTRLVDQRSEASAQSETPILLEQKRRSKRSFTMDQNDIQPQRKPGRRFLNLLAATLACVVLVGSMALIFSALRNRAGVGSPAATHTPAGMMSTPTPTPVALGLHPECKNQLNLAEEQLCLQQQETELNITAKSGAEEIILVRAYADPYQLMIVYAEESADRPKIVDLSIQQGISLKAGAGSYNYYTHLKTNLMYYTITYSTENVPAGTTELHIQKFGNFKMLSGGTSKPLQFTVPFHTDQKNVQVNRAVTHQGITITLEHLSITASATIVQFKVSPLPYETMPLLRSLSINGKEEGGVGGGTHGNDEPGEYTMEISSALLNKSGSWMISISFLVMGASQEMDTSWDFYITVPDLV